MKVLITAHTADEHGMHYPGDVVELSDGEASAYAEKQWGIILPVEKKAIETAEDSLPEHEDASIRRKKK